MPTVSGAVVFQHEVPPGLRADVVVQLLEIAAADAPSRVVVEQTQRDVLLPAGVGGRVPFLLQVDTVNPPLSYTVRAHVRVGGSSAVKSGDYVTMASYPVLTRGGTTSADVGVRRVS